ncbi:hypothetical protein [Rhizobium sp.]|uniref:hypothetical protein n=1 Tax=Rhizobium sp. TaxID=391 RepID=UPI000E8398B2|nr:hypothetical protein [Rhizobium sp.]
MNTYITTPQDFQVAFSDRLVAIATATNGLPILYDSPQQDPGTILNFEVHLVFLVNNNNIPTLQVSRGFKWQYEHPKKSVATITFEGFIDQPSRDFTACMQAAVAFQNQRNQTNWVLAP